MRRHLLSITAAICLILCIGVVVLWARSLGQYEWVFYETVVRPDLSQTEYWIGWGNRSIGVGRNVVQSARPPAVRMPPGWHVMSESDPSSAFLAAVADYGHLWNRFGYARWRTDVANGDSVDSLFISFPHWAAIVLLSVAPILWIVRRLRRRRQRQIQGFANPKTGQV